MSCPSCSDKNTPGACPICGDEIKADALLGRTIGGYLLQRRIGKGGFGAVYEGLHQERQQKAALKVLRPELAESKEAVLRFRREAEATRRLEHPNIVKVLGSGEDESLLWIAMEFLEGTPLDDHLTQVGALSEGAFLQLFQPICAALQEAHQKGVIHRDLKPGNIMLVENRKEKIENSREAGGRGVPSELFPISSFLFPVLLDFGIASLVGADTLTTQSAVSGTPRYMAPEQWEGLYKTEARSDIYSLGVIAYQCLSGQLPFEADSPLAWMKKHHFEEPRDISLALGEKHISAPICRAIMKALQKSPEARHETPLAFWEALCVVEISTQKAPSAKAVSEKLTPRLAPLPRRVPTASTLAVTEKIEPEAPPKKRSYQSWLGAGLLLILLSARWFFMPASASAPPEEAIKKSVAPSSTILTPNIVVAASMPLSQKEQDAMALLDKCREFSERDLLDEAAEYCAKLPTDSEVYQGAAAEVRATLRAFRQLHREAAKVALAAKNREGVTEAKLQIDTLQKVFGAADEEVISLQRELSAVVASLGPTPEELYSQIEQQRKRGDIGLTCKAIKAYLKQSPNGKKSDSLRKELRGYDPAGYPECDLKR